MKARLNLVLSIFIFLLVPVLVFAADETLTVTTYYPSPYGSYNEFKTASNTWLAYASGNVGIGTTSPTSKLQVVGLPVYANNAAAIAGGLTAGAFYRTGGDPDTVCVVH